MFVIYSEIGEYDDYIKVLLFLVTDFAKAKCVVEAYSKIFSNVMQFKRSELSQFQEQWKLLNPEPIRKCPWITDRVPVRPYFPNNLVGKSKSYKKDLPEYISYLAAVDSFDKENTIYKAKERLVIDTWHTKFRDWAKDFNLATEEFIKNHFDLEKLIPDDFKSSVLFRKHIPNDILTFESPTFSFEELDILEIPEELTFS